MAPLLRLALHGTLPKVLLLSPHWPNLSFGTQRMYSTKCRKFSWMIVIEGVQNDWPLETPPFSTSPSNKRRVSRNTQKPKAAQPCPSRTRGVSRKLHSKGGKSPNAKRLMARAAERHVLQLDTTGVFEGKEWEQFIFWLDLQHTLVYKLVYQEWIKLAKLRHHTHPAVRHLFKHTLCNTLTVPDMCDTCLFRITKGQPVVPAWTSLNTGKTGGSDLWSQSRGCMWRRLFSPTASIGIRVERVDREWIARTDESICWTSVLALHWSTQRPNWPNSLTRKSKAS